MKYIIKIDQPSITINPEAGKTSFFERNGEDITIKFHYNKPALPPNFGPFEARIYQYNSSDGVTYEVLASALTIPPNAKELFEEAGIPPGSYSWSIIPRHVEYHSLHPTPKFLYSYMPTQVSCFNCSEVFDYSELLSDVMEDAWFDEIYSDRCCPRCHTFDCCELEFERVENVKNNA